MPTARAQFAAHSIGDVVYAVGGYTTTAATTDTLEAFATAPSGPCASDQTPPSIQTVAVSPGLLWPPNRTMVPVTVTVSAADNCSGSVTCTIIGVSSSEPEGPNGPDWEITGSSTVSLRAARVGSGNGRTYTITVRCTDAAGNPATSTITVTVPHDRRAK